MQNTLFLGFLGLPDNTPIEDIKLAWGFQLKIKKYQSYLVFGTFFVKIFLNFIALYRLIIHYQKKFDHFVNMSAII